MITKTSNVLYPTTIEMKYDSVVKDICTELAKWNWKIDNVVIKLSKKVIKGVEYEYVSRISGKNYRLDFILVEGYVGTSWSEGVRCFLASIMIPNRIICLTQLYDGYFFKYVGDNWNAIETKILRNPILIQTHLFKAMVLAKIITGQGAKSFLKYRVAKRSNCYDYDLTSFWSDKKVVVENTKQDIKQLESEVADWMNYNILHGIWY